MNNAVMPENPQYTHSIKLEETAQGVRISVHCYGNNQAETLNEVFGTYNAAKLMAKEQNILLAPMVIKEK